MRVCIRIKLEFMKKYLAFLFRNASASFRSFSVWYNFFLPILTAIYHSHWKSKESLLHFKNYSFWKYVWFTFHNPELIVSVSKIVLLLTPVQ